MNYRLLTLFIVILGYVIDAVMTFYFVIYTHSYIEIDSINSTVHGLLYTHLTIILLVSLLAFLLWLGEIHTKYITRQTYYVVMCIAGLCLWYPVVANIFVLA